MNEAVQEVIDAEIDSLAKIIRENPDCHIEVSDKGRSWQILKTPIPKEELSDDDFDSWMAENCLAHYSGFEMATRLDVDYPIGILCEALIRVAKLKLVDE